MPEAGREGSKECLVLFLNIRFRTSESGFAKNMFEWFMSAVSGGKGTVELRRRIHKAEMCC